MRTLIQSARRLTHSLLASACVLTCMGAQAATITVTSRDPAGVGFNDTTPAAPVGGNPGTTVGQQRLNVYRFVADVWEKALESNTTINVSAAWEALTCTANSAVLGSAGAWNIWHDFQGGKPGTWYPQALANKLYGSNLSANVADDGSGYGNVDIKTQFNVNLGNADCLAGSSFYLGLDGNAGAKVNFVETLLHELGHGLGFSVLSVQTSSGNRLNASGSAYVASGGLPSVWENFMFDNTANKSWLDMTNTERKASAINPLKLAWTGANAVDSATFLSKVPVIATSSPVPGGSGTYTYFAAAFGPAITTPSALGTLANINDVAGAEGCTAFSSTNAAAVAGKVAIITRGGCGFVAKVKNAQTAGAVGVILANSDSAITTPGGADPTITIPSALVSKADGLALKAAVTAAVPYGSRRSAGVVGASWSVDPSRIAGADTQGRPLLYTPATLAAGSSVSHWDVSATPNLLMEPNINSDLGLILVAPKDLTVPLLKDLGW